MSYTVKITRRRGELRPEERSTSATIGVKIAQSETTGTPATVKVMDETEITDFFFPADVVVAHGYFDVDADLAAAFSAWDAWPETYFRCMYIDDGVEHYESSRLIEFTHNGETRWVLATRCWLLGPDGRTIERLN